MNSIQVFLREYTQEAHTIREIFNALISKGLSEKEAAEEFKKYEKSIPQADFDELMDHPIFNKKVLKNE